MRKVTFWLLSGLLSLGLLLCPISHQFQKMVTLSYNEEALDMVVDGELVKTYTVDELSDEPTVEITCPVRNKEVEVIPLTDLLTEIDVDPEDVESFTPLASDDYSVDIDGEEIENAYIRIIEEECIDRMGYLRLIVLGIDKENWVHHLVEIEFELI